MLQKVDVESQPLAPYAEVVGSDRMDALRQVARDLKDVRVVHVSATAFGGGVAELLRSVVPLERALGVDAEWRVIPGSDPFFDMTKQLHNALQGGAWDISDDAREVYLRASRDTARGMVDTHDVVVVHDPQPLPLRHFREDDGLWIWRCHIDTSAPNPDALELVTPFVRDHDALVFTMPEFIPPQWSDRPTAIIPPAIDPLSPKNMPLTDDITMRIVRWLGVDSRRPLLSQVSRFDPWKDPLGVVEVYRSIRERVPGLQLALLGSMALDDPQGWDIYERVRREVSGDLDVHVATNVTGVSNVEVNAVQRHSDVVIQKSIREGFGLVVSETLWKGTPVVAGRAGGIPLQMPDGVGGVLVDDPADYGERVAELLLDRERATELGEAGRRHVTERFLMDRLVGDELALISGLVAGDPRRASA